MNPIPIPNIPLPQHAKAGNWADLQFGPDAAFRVLTSVTHRIDGELVEASAAQDYDGTLRNICVRAQLGIWLDLDVNQFYWEDEHTPAEMRAHAAQWRDYGTRLLRLADRIERAADIADQWGAR